MKFLFFSFLLLVLFSCGNDVSDNEGENPKSDSTDVKTVVAKGEVKIIEPVKDEDVVVLKSDGITLTEIKQDYSNNVTLELNTKQFNEGENHFNFSVKGVDDYSISYLANNYSLTQFNSDVFDVELLYGNNVFLAFLTDNKYISIKTNKGCVLRNAILGADAESMFDMNQPHLFYCLPQAETNEAVLDFYLVNTSISEIGNKVKVTINETEFIIDKWAAYKISGLKFQTENNVRIQLLDKNGDLIDGPFNDSGVRKSMVRLNI